MRVRVSVSALRCPEECFGTIFTGLLDTASRGSSSVRGSSSSMDSSSAMDSSFLAMDASSVSGWRLVDASSVESPHVDLEDLLYLAALGMILGLASGIEVEGRGVSSAGAWLGGRGGGPLPRGTVKIMSPSRGHHRDNLGV